MTEISILFQFSLSTTEYLPRKLERSCRFIGLKKAGILRNIQLLKLLDLKSVLQKLLLRAKAVEKRCGDVVLCVSGSSGPVMV